MKIINEKNDIYGHYFLVSVKEGEIITLNPLRPGKTWLDQKLQEIKGRDLLPEECFYLEKIENNKYQAKNNLLLLVYRPVTETAACESIFFVRKDRKQPSQINGKYLGEEYAAFAEAFRNRNGPNGATSTTTLIGPEWNIRFVDELLVVDPLDINRIFVTRLSDKRALMKKAQLA